MRGDLVRKLIARGLATGLAVLAFLVVALTGATGWGLGLVVAALGAVAWERRVRPGADSVAETTLIAAGILVGYARRLDAGFDPMPGPGRRGRDAQPGVTDDGLRAGCALNRASR